MLVVFFLLPTHQDARGFPFANKNCPVFAYL